MTITITMIVFLVITLIACSMCLYTAFSLKEEMSYDEIMYLIEKHGHKGYVPIKKLHQMDSVVIEENTEEEIAEREAFYKERDEKRAAEKKALGFVEAECPACECKFLTRRVRDDHIKEE